MGGRTWKYWASSGPVFFPCSFIRSGTQQRENTVLRSIYGRLGAPAAEGRFFVFPCKYFFPVGYTATGELRFEVHPRKAWVPAAVGRFFVFPCNFFGRVHDNGRITFVCTEGSITT